jgi:hypothetical protein
MILQSTSYTNYPLPFSKVSFIRNYGRIHNQREKQNTAWQKEEETPKNVVSVGNWT